MPVHLQKRKRLQELQKEIEFLRTELDLSPESPGNDCDLLRRFIHILPTALFYLDRHLIFRQCNATGARALCCPMEEIIGRSLDEVLPERPALREEIQKVFQSGAPLDFSVVLQRWERCPDKENRHYQLTCRPDRDESGEIRGVFVEGQDITENILARSLETERARLATILNTLPVGVFVLDAEGRVIENNTIVERIWGGKPPLFEGPEKYKRKTSQYKGWRTDTGELIAPSEWAAARAVLRGETVIEEETRILRFDGRDGVILNSAVPLRDDEGRITGAVAVIQDVTHARKTQKELQESESLFRNLFENSHAVMLLMAPGNGRIIEANSAACAFYGYSREEMLRKSIFDLNTLDRKSLLKEMERARKQKGIYFIFRHRLSSGDERDVEIFSGPVRLGGETFLFSIIHDITERKKAEADRERLLAELDATISSIAAGVIIYSPEGKVLRANPTAKIIIPHSVETWELPIEERLRRLVRKTLKGEPYRFGETPLQRALKGETVQGVLLLLRHEKEPRNICISLSTAPIRTTDGEMLGAVAVFSDVTALHEMQEEREDLLRMISHDLRTPLTIISGHAEIIEKYIKSTGADEDLGPNVTSILKSTEWMDGMIDHVVDLVRLESGGYVSEKENIDFDNFLQEFLQRAASALDISRVRADTPPGLPPVVACPNALERILMNLLTNALKYSEPGTPIRIDAKRKEQWVILSVRDCGKGISAEDMPHLFERFYRSKNTQKEEGLGLGLYITRLLVEAHGGRIRVESEPGRGSAFIFTLPAASEL